MKIFKFVKPAIKNEKRPYLIAIPAYKIFSIESQYGSENVFCKVNGIEVDYSYDKLIKELEMDF